jgi:hypothetical protein
MTYAREVELTAERLRHLSPARLLPAEGRLHHLLGLMTDRPVPRLAPQAWGDQLAVIAREVPEAAREALVPVVREFRRSLDLTP